MICPRCTTALLERQVRANVTVDVCGRCRGMWLDRGELETLNAHAVVAARYADDLEDDDDDDLVEAAPCPVTTARMVAAINGAR